MDYPLIPKAEALELLEDAEHAEESRSEMLAEDGASAFALYGNAGDAMIVARQIAAEREADFLNSEEGARWSARLSAARLYESVWEARLSDWSIPEFVIGDSDEGAAHELLLRFYAHSPFSHIVTNDRHDDIPF